MFDQQMMIMKHNVNITDGIIHFPYKPSKNINSYLIVNGSKQMEDTDYFCLTFDYVADVMPLMVDFRYDNQSSTGITFPITNNYWNISEKKICSDEFHYQPGKVESIVFWFDTRYLYETLFHLERHFIGNLLFVEAPEIVHHLNGINKNQLSIEDFTMVDEGWRIKLNQIDFELNATDVISEKWFGREFQQTLRSKWIKLTNRTVRISYRLTDDLIEKGIYQMSIIVSSLDQMVEQPLEVKIKKRSFMTTVLTEMGFFF